MIFSFVHAKWTAADREILWAALINDESLSLPWFIAGDFNVIAGEEEKIGVPFRIWEGVELLSFMSMAGLMDAGFRGSKFTWRNNGRGCTCIWKCLDKLLYDQSVLGLGINFMVQHLSRPRLIMLHSCYLHLLGWIALPNRFSF